MIELRSERIVTPGRTIAGAVVVDGGRIADVRRSVGDRGGADAAWIVPGFIDLHVHGGGGAQCNTDDPDEIAAVAHFHAAHGTTAILATTVAAPVEELERAVGAIARAGVAVPAVLGAHLEGPFISPRWPGAMDPETFMDPEPGVLERLLAGGGVRLMTVAPELPGAPKLISSLSARGVLASVGHTDASYEQARAGVDAGARSVTHLFNAMRPFHHRDPGVVGAALDLRELSCELIADRVHVDPVALRLAWRARGMHGLRLATDAIAAAGMPDGEYRLGAAPVALAEGRAVIPGTDTLAGGTLTMDAALRNAVASLGLSVEQAVALSCANPARLLGLGERKGAIAAGMDADLVLLDDELRVQRTMIAGAWAA